MMIQALIYMKLVLLLAFVTGMPCVVTAQEPPIVTAQEPQSEWTTLFDGSSLDSWHVSAETGHSSTSGNKSGGRWVVENGAITGSQDIPGNGGIILTNEKFGDFEVVFEMKNDFGPDSGLFLRSTESGTAYQAMIDYHSGGNLMGIYGEGMDGDPHIRNFEFKELVTDVEAVKIGNPTVEFPILAEAWPSFWRHEEWNELRARIVGGELPTITTWINGVKISEWTETTARHPATGSIGLQVHGGGDPKDYDGKFVRYRSVRVRKLN